LEAFPVPSTRNTPTDDHFLLRVLADQRNLNLIRITIIGSLVSAEERLKGEGEGGKVGFFSDERGGDWKE
jgi:hypothetical protein